MNSSVCMKLVRNKRKGIREDEDQLFLTNSNTLNNTPDILVLQDNRIEFNGSLLQFKHKASSVLRNYIFDPPTDFI